MGHDFSGYATRNDLKCSDGRVIRRDSFAHQDGKTVPLVWQHDINSPENVLGHAKLENRPDGVYCYGSFNDGESAKQAKNLLTHGDLKSLSIRAGKLVQKGLDVLHGEIVEVSLVLKGANPGAFIDDIAFAHGDEEDPIEAIIYSGDDLEITHSDGDDSDETVAEIIQSMTDKQREVMYYIIGALSEEAAEHSDDTAENTETTDSEEETLTHNVFESKGDEKPETTLTHEQRNEILGDAIRSKSPSLRDTMLQHAGTYGINNIDILFPDAKAVRQTPDFIKRRTDWVAGVLSGTHHTPFSRIKSVAADITADEARAKGYIKGNRKKDEVFKLLKRVTTPTTVYKKQKLDRDDIIDITDMDVVPFIKAEMRLMLDEEIARAILFGDGRDSSSDDKINEDNIRPIWTDDDLYAPKVQFENTATPLDFVEGALRARTQYKGKGSPTLFVSPKTLTDLLLIKEGNDKNRRLFETEAALASAMRVSNIVEVELMEGLVRTDKDQKKHDLVGIIVNLDDYTVGADRGGQISMFDDFDIDFNQYKYLLETRMSGALTKPQSAVILEKKQA